MKVSNIIQSILLLIILTLQFIFLLVSFDKKVSLSSDDILTTTGLVLTILGWFAVYYFGFRQSKNTISLDRKIEIYDRLTKLKENVHNKFSFELVAYVRYVKNYYLLDSPKEVLKYGQDLTTKNIESSEIFLKFDNCVRDWIFLMPSLEKTEVVLFKEFYNLSSKIDKLATNIQNFAIKLAKIDQKNIEEKINEILKDSTNVINFIDDFMELVSDELTFPIFRFRMWRGLENLKEGQLYKKLTLSGIEEVPYKLKDFQKDLKT